MRRFAIFALVFSVGMAILWQLDKRGREADEEARARSSQGGQAGPPLVVPDGVTEPGGETPEAGVPAGVPTTTAGISGYLSLERFDETSGELVSKLEAQDVEQVGESIEIEHTLTDVVAQHYDAADGKLLRTITADTGHTKLEMEPGSFSPKLQEDGLVRLIGVEMVQPAGLSYAPVTLNTAAIDAYLDKERYITPGVEPVFVRGTGLTAEGRGLDMNGPEQTLILKGGGWAELTASDGRVARIESTQGPLLVEPRPNAGEGALRVVAGGGAHLNLSGMSGMDLVATELEVHLLEVAEGEYLLERAFARGNVIATRGLDRFSGNDGEASFDTNGELASMKVQGQPELSMTLQDDEGVPLVVSAEGAGPVRFVVDGEGGNFVFHGPGELEAAERDTRIKFQGKLAGVAAPDRSSGRFEASGQAEFLQAGSIMRSDSLGAVLYSGEPTRADVTTAGPTVADSFDKDGIPVAFRAEGGLELKVLGEAWTVPEADSVRVEAGGEQPYFAAAGHILDFDWQERTFRADRGVNYTSAYGTGRAANLEVRADGVHHMQGDEQEPATLLLFPSASDDNTLRGGSFRAQVIDMHPDWAEARGQAHLLLAQGQDVIEARAELLRVESDPANDGAPRHMRVSADEVEQLELRTPGQTFSFQGKQLRIAATAFESGESDAAQKGFWVESVALEGDVTIQGRGGIELDVDAAEFELYTYAMGGVRGDQPAAGGPLGFTWLSNGVERLAMRDWRRETDLSAEAIEITGQVTDLDTDEPRWTVVRAFALGKVHATVEGDMEIEVFGERFELLQEGRVLLAPRAGELVVARGRLPGNQVEFDIRAESVDATFEKLVAIGVQADVNVPLLPLNVPGPATPVAGVAPPTVQSAFIRAARLEATRKRIEFNGGVQARGTDLVGVPVSLRAKELTIAGDFEATGGPMDRIHHVLARGEFAATYGGLGRIGGDILDVSAQSILLTGVPATIHTGSMLFESGRLDVDLETFLVTSTRGVVRSADQSLPWSLEFASIQPRQQGADTLMVIASPVYVQLERTARAVWAGGWIKQAAWQAHGRQLLYGESLPLDPEPVPTSAHQPAAPPQADLVQEAFTRLYAGTLSEYLRSALMEGEVEASVSGRRVARADSVYMDMEAGRGWLRGVELSYDMGMGGRTQRLRTRADELVSQPDGALVAETATLTTCTHDVPHYTIQTGRLALVPREDGRWRFSAEDNRVIFRRGIQLPLPPIRNVVLDEAGEFEGFESEEGEVTTIDSIILQNTPRFGTAIGTRLALDIGRLGKWVAGLLSFDDLRTRGKWHTEGAWLSSRGALLGVGLELREVSLDEPDNENYWLKAWVRGIADEGEDRGLVRVPEESRSSLRNWFSVRGRYPFDNSTWVDVVLNTQSDAGVQSEFFEREYQNFEERDSYVHWRRADDGNYYYGRAQWRVDGFRNEVEQLPSLGAYVGRRKIGGWEGLPLNYSAGLDVARLRRREGTAPSEGELLGIDGQADGLGVRDVLRADSTQRLELNYESSGVNLTPFLEGRGTVWDQGVEEEDAPTRTALFGGVELATTLVRGGAGGYHTLAPVARYRSQLAFDQRTGTAVHYDGVEQNIDGDKVQYGLRSLWRRPVAGDSLDLEFLASRRTNREEGLPGSERFLVLGKLRTEIGGVPVALYHDGRYDSVDDKTAYSNTTFAVRPTDDLIMQVGYQRGLDDGFSNLYETASLQARYQISPKWEVELLNWVSIISNDSLRNQFTLRRIAHDFVLEMGISHIAGEGGTGITFNFMPLLTFRRSNLGILDR